VSEEQGPADPGLAAERDRLAQTLRETRLQLAMTQARLAALEQSATMELGGPWSGPRGGPGPAASSCPRTWSGCGGSAVA
jgi:hypothetical protein